MIVVGIDPGYTGAIVALTDYGAVDAYSMPIFTTKKAGGGVNRDVNGAEVARLLTDIKTSANGEVRVVIERVQAMPTIVTKNGRVERRGQGASSAFKFGEATGIVRGVVAALHLPVRRVAPTTWKRTLCLTGKGKDAARQKATDLFPYYAHLWRTKSRGGVADALLMAYFDMTYPENA